MVETASPFRSARPHAGVRLLVPFAALAIVLSACSTGGGTVEPTQQEPSMQPSTPEPTSPVTPPGGGAPSASPSAPGTSAPPAAAGTNALLTITLQQDAAAEPLQYTLECVDGTPGPATTLPGAEDACAALARLGTDFFTARPDKDIICTQQYGGPQTASITGDLDGTSILATFSLTDGCQISRWTSIQDVLGAPGAV